MYKFLSKYLYIFTVSSTELFWQPQLLVLFCKNNIFFIKFIHLATLLFKYTFSMCIYVVVCILDLQIWQLGSLVTWTNLRQHLNPPGCRMFIIFISPLGVTLASEFLQLGPRHNWQVQLFVGLVVPALFTMADKNTPVESPSCWGAVWEEC